MSQSIKDKFYHLFWNNPSCQNLFLLSKEELLDTKIVENGDFFFQYYTNRIIITNTQDNQNELIDTIKTRSELHNIEIDSLLKEKLESLKPIIEQFFNSKFKKSIEKVNCEIENNPSKFFARILRVIFDGENLETNTIEFLQEYGFAGKHLKSFKEIEINIEKSLTPTKNNKLINGKTIHTFFEGIKSIKELYVNYSYKNLYNTNQILINTLNSEDNFQSRIRLFGDLYDSKVISPSKDDAFIECLHCDQLTYRGVFQLRLNPKNLKDLKCPICSKELTYFVPYELHNDIYESVKSHDGLILEALGNKLSSNDILFKLNERFLSDIEIDCIFRVDNKVYIVETKMYKLNPNQEKLISKIKEHFSKLVNDIERIENNTEFQGVEIIPLLLTNINDSKILGITQQYFIAKSRVSKYYNIGKIINLNLLKFSEQL